MTSSYMMALGEYRFSIDTAAYQQLQRTTEYRWQSQARVGRLPAQQYVGPGSDSITLNGIIHPYYKGGLKQLDAHAGRSGKRQIPAFDRRPGSPLATMGNHPH